MQRHFFANRIFDPFNFPGMVRIDIRALSGAITDESGYERMPKCVVSHQPLIGTSTGPMSHVTLITKSTSNSLLQGCAKRTDQNALNQPHSDGNDHQHFESL